MNPRHVMTAPLVHRSALDEPWIDPDLLARGTTTTPERALLLAMIENALTDLLGGVAGVSRFWRGPSIRSLALSWFRDRSGAATFGTAAHAFEHLGIDHDWFLRELGAMLAARRGYRSARRRR